MKVLFKTWYFTKVSLVGQHVDHAVKILSVNSQSASLLSRKHYFSWIREDNLKTLRELKSHDTVATLHLRSKYWAYHEELCITERNIAQCRIQPTKNKVGCNGQCFRFPTLSLYVIILREGYVYWPGFWQYIDNATRPGKSRA